MSLNAFIIKTLEKACPPSNPVLDAAEEFTGLASRFDPDAPPRIRDDMKKALRAAAERLAQSIDDAPEHEPDR